ncbi:hypothetical protein RM697_02345 [Ichthyenterobacterium sp. W332]|uniref:Oxidoreductase n=1 Tax=Microcosmobacter mediterraneus TaxID=3075607 RepID=A0ABU2YJS7_9FLAO|nr:hypothetical protein [Ichthyenterobacterium sp. W332]MDT0557470.1 hypothetical protein [Ichthyenterobacterium sp. W332]
MKTILRLIIITMALNLSSCVQETHIKHLTLKVDMRSVNDFNSVGVRGSMTDKQWQETLPLIDNNNDSIYEITLSEKTAINSIEFKFVINNSDYELKGYDNRVINFEYKPETIIYETIFNNSEATITKN